MLDYLGQHFTQPAKITEGARANVNAYPPSFEPEIISVLRETLVRSFSPGIREVLAFRRETPLPIVFIAPSLPLQGDQAVDAHAARAPAPHVI